MEGRIAQLEDIARRLEASDAGRRLWMEEIHAYSQRFLSKTQSEGAYNSDAQAIRELDEFPITESGRDLKDLLGVIERAVDTPGINPASGGHLGYIPGGGIVPAAYGDYLAAITNRYAGVYYANPGAVKMENDLIRWMCDLIGYGPSALGNLASGGSIANLMAITTARDAMGITCDRIRNVVIYLSKQTHHCVYKAIRIAGLGEAHVREIPLDSTFRMRADALDEAIKSDRKAGLQPFLLVASLGSTDVGAVDPISELGKLCQSEKIWFHVDAAYGGFFVLVRSMQNLFADLNLADSVVMDPHKTLFLPYGTGALLIKEGSHLAKSHAYKANYMQDAVGARDEWSPAELSPELTKHFRGLRMWLPLQLHGLQPFRAALEEKHVLTKYFYLEIQKLGFEVGPEPSLSVCIYRYIPTHGDANAFNQRLVESVQEDGQLFISSTTIDDVYWIRIAIVCFRTHRDWVDRYLTVIRTKLQTLKSQFS